MAKKTMTVGFVTAGKEASSTSARRSAASALTQRPNKSSNTGTFVLEKPGKGITMKESRRRMLKQLDGSFKRLA